MRQPIQPLEKDDNGILRFKQNAIVRYLLDAGPFDMNQLAMIPFPQEDQEQFAQLIGYSLSGFGDLSYVPDSTYNRAESKSKEKPMSLSNINIPTYKGTGLDDVEIIISEFAGRMQIKIKDDNKVIETECHFEDIQQGWNAIKGK